MKRLGMIGIDYDAATHIGQRKQNQDSVLVASVTVSPDRSGQIFAVADGLGGHPGGDVASRLACEELKAHFNKQLKLKPMFRPADISRQLIEVIIRIDRHIRLFGLGNKDYEEMGTTLSCLVINDTHTFIGHVGDSRIYRQRRGHLSCLTVDHTLVRDLVLEGEIDANEANLNPLRHMLTRAVGTGEPLSLVDTRIDPLQNKDCFLLCTDGLYNAVSDHYISLLMSDAPFVHKTAERLVNKAIKNGGRDNITAIVIQT